MYRMYRMYTYYFSPSCRGLSTLMSSHLSSSSSSFISGNTLSSLIVGWNSNVSQGIMFLRAFSFNVIFWQTECSWRIFEENANQERVMEANEVCEKEWTKGEEGKNLLNNNVTTATKRGGETWLHWKQSNESRGWVRMSQLDNKPILWSLSRERPSL